jgi:predicted permease
MNYLWMDIRYAVRQLCKSPGFALTAVLTLALGIGANSTIASWISSTLLNPIPGVADTSSMITIMRGARSEYPTPPLSYPDYVDLRDNAKSLSGLLAYHDDFMSITGTDKPVRIYGVLASANYFEVLGVRPILGRTLQSTQQNERQGAAETVLGYDLWRNRFGGDGAIIGKTIQINLHSYTVVGVAPKGFQGCKGGLRAEIWLPLGMNRQVWGWDRTGDRGVSWLNALGVMRQGVDHHQVETDLNLAMQRIISQYPTTHHGPNEISTDPLWRSPFGANGYFYGILPILLALAGVLLLLACANVANLLLVRSVARRREFAIRMSMGASRWRLVRQLLLENLLVAMTGGGLALLGTLWTSRTLNSFMPITSLPIALGGGVDRTVLLATILVSILTAAIAGVLPALRAAAISPMAVLKDEALNTSGGLHKSRLAASLVIAQVAMSLVLLSCAGLFVRSLQMAQKSELGFDPNHVLLATFDLSPFEYSRTKGIEFERQLLTNLRALPGVQSATLADFSPMNFTIHSDGVMPAGYVPRLHESMEVDRGVVESDYLQTLRTSLHAGRDFSAADNADTEPVSIVNQALVDRYWMGQNAVGKRLQVAGRWTTVVGVVANGKYRRLTYDVAPLVLLPMAQSFRSEAILHIRTAGDPMALSAAVERKTAELNPNLPLYNVATLKASMQTGNVFERIAVIFAGSFGLLALALAAVGIYGVVAYTTRQRTHEIGIRMALGSGQADVFRQVLGQGLRLTLSGLAVGLLVSLALTYFLRGMLFGIATTDWLTFATVAIVLCVVALAACFVPARRAASIDPMQALRSE